LNILDRFSKKDSNIKFHEYLSGGSQFVLCKQMDRQTGTTKVTVTFSNFANIYKNGLESTHKT